jgi:phosphatidylserine synthase
LESALVENESIAHFVDMWTVAWTAAIAVGYVARFTPWPGLKVLKSNVMTHLMMLSSAAVVLGLTLLEASEIAAVLTAWAVVIASVKLIYDSLGQHE